MDRIILHCDLNNFYASCECVCNPELKDKPIVVCGDCDLRHGIVLAKNYIAKSCGIKTGDVLWEAKKKCGTLVSINANFSRYLKFSNLVREIYSDYTDYIEAFGIDECWLDITKSISRFGTAEQIANSIKNRIKDELGLTISVGISYNKIFAKLGSDKAGRDSIFIINRENYKELVFPLNVEELLYVGPATKRKLLKYGINTIGKLAQVDENVLISKFGKWGKYLHTFANGDDYSPVRKVGTYSTIKSVGNSCTTPYDLTTVQQVELVVNMLCESVASRMKEYNLVGRVISLYVKDNNLMSFQKQSALKFYTNCCDDIFKQGMRVFNQLYDFKFPIRCLGVTMSGLKEKRVAQLDFFNTEQKREKLITLENSVDNIRNRFGHNKIFKAMNLLQMDLVELNPKSDHTIHPICYFR